MLEEVSLPAINATVAVANAIKRLVFRSAIRSNLKCTACLWAHSSIVAIRWTVLIVIMITVKKCLCMNLLQHGIAKNVHR